MSGVKRWRDTEHLERAVETAGGQKAFDAAVGTMLDEARGWRLAELRRRREMTQEQVASPDGCLGGTGVGWLRAAIGRSSRSEAPWRQGGGQAGAEEP
jgi:hypothetical protein